MNMKLRRLPESELEIMLIIWDAKEAVPRTYIENKLNERKKLAPTTILSFLSRLEKKGFLKVEKRGKSNYYLPIIEKRLYVQNEGKNILERFYGSSLKNFVAHLYSTSSISNNELSELKKFIEHVSREDAEK